MKFKGFKKRIKKLTNLKILKKQITLALLVVSLSWARPSFARSNSDFHIQEKCSSKKSEEILEISVIEDLECRKQENVRKKDPKLYVSNENNISNDKYNENFIESMVKGKVSGLRFMHESINKFNVQKNILINTTPKLEFISKPGKKPLYVLNPFLKDQRIYSHPPILMADRKFYTERLTQMIFLIKKYRFIILVFSTCIILVLVLSTLNNQFGFLYKIHFFEKKIETIGPSTIGGVQAVDVKNISPLLENEPVDLKNTEDIHQKEEKIRNCQLIVDSLKLRGADIKRKYSALKYIEEYFANNVETVFSNKDDYIQAEETIYARRLELAKEKKLWQQDKLQFDKDCNF